jgi:hypothetical protein
MYALDIFCPYQVFLAIVGYTLVDVEWRYTIVTVRYTCLGYLRSTWVDVKAFPARYPLVTHGVTFSHSLSQGLRHNLQIIP